MPRCLNTSRRPRHESPGRRRGLFPGAGDRSRLRPTCTPCFNSWLPVDCGAAKPPTDRPPLPSPPSPKCSTAATSTPANRSLRSRGHCSCKPADRPSRPADGCSSPIVDAPPWQSPRRRRFGCSGDPGSPPPCSTSSTGSTRSRARAPRTCSPRSKPAKPSPSPLANCPRDEWIPVDDLFSTMRSKKETSPTIARSERGLWKLYLVDPQYGSLGYSGFADWPILEGPLHPRRSVRARNTVPPRATRPRTHHADPLAGAFTIREHAAAAHDGRGAVLSRTSGCLTPCALSGLPAVVGGRLAGGQLPVLMTPSNSKTGFGVSWPCLSVMVARPTILEGPPAT
jgi:hypothetical protein